MYLLNQDTQKTLKAVYDFTNIQYNKFRNRKFVLLFPSASHQKSSYEGDDALYNAQFNEHFLVLILDLFTTSDPTVA